MSNDLLTVGRPFGDRMVLQRQKPIRIWGTGELGRPVTVRLGPDAAGHAVVSPDGSWSVTLTSQEAARGLRLVVSDGRDELEFADVAVGEVWIAGGQSNMEYFLAFDAKRGSVLNGPMNPDIRFFDTPRASYEGQLEEKDYSRFGFWRPCTREDLPYFSAPAYYFAAELQRSLGVPVGIVGCNWGGTPACAWTGEEYLEDNEGRVWLEDYRSRLDGLDLDRLAAEFRADQWFSDTTNPLQKGAKSLVMYPGFPRVVQMALLARPARRKRTSRVIGPLHPLRPAGVYHTMLKHVAPYTARGVIWYQGESDAPHADIYATVFASMIRSWRDLWSDELPFLFVQLAPFEEWMGSPGDAFPELRRQQQIVANTVPSTWMASSADVGMKWDIHPKHKKPIGRRLALLARRHVYGHDLLGDPPRLLSAERTADGIEILLSNADGLRRTRGKIPIEVHSPSGSQIKVNMVRVIDNRLILTGSFPAGSIVRFAWSCYYKVNLVNAAGNPATPFTIQL